MSKQIKVKGWAVVNPKKGFKATVVDDWGCDCLCSAQTFNGVPVFLARKEARGYRDLLEDKVVPCTIFYSLPKTKKK